MPGLQKSPETKQWMAVPDSVLRLRSHSVTLKGGGCIVIEAWILEMSARWDIRVPLRKVAGTKYWPDTEPTNATGDRTVQWTIRGH